MRTLGVNFDEMLSFIRLIVGQIFVGAHSAVVEIAHGWNEKGVFEMKRKVSSLVQDVGRGDQAIFQFRSGNKRWNEYHVTKDGFPNADRRWPWFTTTRSYNYNLGEDWNGKIYAIAIGRIPGVYLCLGRSKMTS